MKFPFEFESRYSWMLRPLGVTPDRSFVEIEEETLRVKFGRWEVVTPLANVAVFQRSGNYKWYKAIGVRGSLKDHGLTFGSSTRQGVCFEFFEPIKPFIPGMPHHPGLTVTVADPDGLAGVLEASGIEARQP